MEAGCSAKSISRIMRIDINTFYRAFKREFGCGFADLHDEFAQCGKDNIRYVQYMKALSDKTPGSSTMLIHLGKEWLGQGRIDTTIPPNQQALDFENEIRFLRCRIIELENDIDRQRKTD